MFTLDRDSSVALSDQIEARLRELVARGQLPAGARLTSIRQLAAELAVSPNTVITAYDRLVAAGVIDARGTAGYFVNPRQGEMPEEVALEAGDEQEPVWLVQQANDQRAGVLLASSGALLHAWLEDAVPAAAVQRALSRSVAGMASRCPPQGLPELRERIAMMLRGIGIAVDAGRILTTYGGTHAIDLICRSFVKPGDAVLVEDPGYFLMLGRLQQDGIRVLPIARRHDGVDLSALNELVMLEILAAGRWRKHLDRLQRRLASARHASQRQLASAGIRFDHPGEVGLFLWGEVPEGVDIDLLVQDAVRNKILLARGATFMVDGAADPHLRFNVAICQAPAVADYLRKRLQAIDGARRVLMKRVDVARH